MDFFDFQPGTTENADTQAETENVSEANSKTNEDDETNGSESEDDDSSANNAENMVHFWRSSSWFHVAPHVRAIVITSAIM